MSDLTDKKAIKIHEVEDKCVTVGEARDKWFCPFCGSSFPTTDEAPNDYGQVCGIVYCCYDQYGIWECQVVTEEVDVRFWD